MKLALNNILLIYLILNIFMIFIYLPLILDPSFTTTDCYETFSSPKKHLILNHYNKIGPIYLHITYIYKLYSYLFGYTAKYYYDTYYLKRINGNCTSSFALTTIAKDFKKIEISIVISLLSAWQHIALIDYTFDQGANHGHYKIMDQSQNFALDLKVIHTVDNPLSHLVHSWKNAKSYLDSLSHQNSEICVITENNRMIRLKPEYLRSKPESLITALHVKLIENGRLLSYFNYQAFDCDINKTYDDENTVFILERYKFINVKFFALHCKDYERYTNYDLTEFIIPNAKFKDLSNPHFYVTNENKVFLFPRNEFVLDCDDGTKRFVYKSQNNTIYYAKERLEVEVSSGVKHKRNLSKSPIAPCN